jgi:hypothetical protein
MLAMMLHCGKPRPHIRLAGRATLRGRAGRFGVKALAQRGFLGFNLSKIG